MRILVTGAAGMVGGVLAKQCRAAGDEVFAPGRMDLDISDAAQVAGVFAQTRPEAVINCAAWTDVDGCELDPTRSYAVHAEAVETLARESRRAGAAFLNISTDYVFDGEKEGFYTQRADPNPQGAYARSKLAGERLAQNAYARTIVVRTGWIFGPGGRNFLSRVVELARAGTPLRAIHNAYGTPTYAVDLARRLRELVRLDLPGIYHVVNRGEGASYEDFTRVALAAAGMEGTAVERVSAETLSRPAPRPRNSRLRCLLSEVIGLEPLPPWQDALRTFVQGSGAGG
ncbi:MAG: dTDP-4-dehydrorhamnose reductase, partial [Pyrinomonadaceae bacterium]